MGFTQITSRAIIGSFYEILEQASTSWTNSIAMDIASNQSSETYAWLGASPAMREWLGGRLAKTLRENPYTLANKVYESTLMVDVDDLRRDKTGQLNVRIGEQVDRAANHTAQLLSAAINDNGLCYDGQNFFDTDHLEGDSTTQSNLLTVSDFANLAVVAAAAPTPDEMSRIVLDLISHFYTLKDDQGEPINENAKNFVFMVPINYWASALSAVTSNNLSTGNGVRDNLLVGNAAMNIELVPNSRLDETDEVFLFRSDGRAKPFINQIELPLQISAIAEGTEEEFKNNRHLYGIKSIRGLGYGYWQQAIKATISTAS